MELAPGRGPLEAIDARRSAPLRAIQRGLEVLYRIETRLDIHDFLLSSEQRARLVPQACRRPPEQLLLMESEDGLDLALYLEDAALQALHLHDPRDGVTERNLDPLLLVLEGVSHFIYAVDRAQCQRSVSVLELELQAEVDKYVCLVLLTWGSSCPRELLIRLFHQVVYRADLSAEEHERYTTANAAAASYAAALERRYLRRAAPAPCAFLFLQEVRRFWRLSFGDKLSHISRSAD